jgi:hypothetical protein
MDSESLTDEEIDQHLEAFLQGREQRLQRAWELMNGPKVNDPRLIAQARTFNQAFRMIHQTFKKRSYTKALEDMVSTVRLAQENCHYDNIEVDYHLLEEYVARAGTARPTIRTTHVYEEAVQLLARYKNVYHSLTNIVIPIVFVHKGTAGDESYKRLVTVAKTLDLLGFVPQIVYSLFERDLGPFREGFVNYYSRKAMQEANFTPEQIEEIEPVSIPYDPTVDEQRLYPVHSDRESFVQESIYTYVAEYQSNHGIHPTLKDIQKKFRGLDPGRVDLVTADLVEEKRLTAITGGKTTRYSPAPDANPL